MTAQARISFRDVLSDAIAFWEPRRLIYNIALAAVVVAFAVIFWGRIKANLSFEAILALVVLAVLANVCYCAAYVADLPMQLSAFRERWRHWRWALWLFGVLFGVALAWYWTSDEILPALLASK